MLHFLRTNETNGCYNASEMGTGKSCETVVTLNELSVSKVLIVCPKSMLFTWAKELQKWSAVPRSINIMSKAADVRKVKESNVTIINYDLIARAEVLGVLHTVNWCAIVCDEAHKIKNYSAQRSRAVYKYLFPKARYKILLSGTPFLRDITDGFTPFKALAPSLFPDFYAFANRYALSIETQWGTKYFGIQNADELKALIRKNFYLRDTMEEVGLQLPPVEFIKIHLSEDYLVKMPKDAAEAAKMEAKALCEAITNNQDTTRMVPKNLMALRKLQGVEKIKPIADFARELLDQEIPIVIFAYHKDVVYGLEKELKEFNPYTLTGETTGVERNRAIEAFQSGQGNCFIANLVAGGVGITLTRASVCLICEYTFSPADISQAIGRIKRIGQQNNMFVYYFAVKNSIDQDLIDVTMDKARNFDMIVEN